MLHKLLIAKVIVTGALLVILTLAAFADAAKPRIYTDLEQAQLMQIASGAGALQFCKRTKLYDSPAFASVFSRLVAIFAGHGDDHDAVGELGILSYQIGVVSSESGAYVRVPKKIKGKLVAKAVMMKTEKDCQMVEGELLPFMDNGKLLDVKPAVLPGEVEG